VRNLRPEVGEVPLDVREPAALALGFGRAPQPPGPLVVAAPGRSDGQDEEHPGRQPAIVHLPHQRERGARALLGFVDASQLELAFGEVSAADIGKPTIGTTVVSYLRAHPNVKYVGVGFGLLATGLPAALQAAGLNDVKLVALIASPESLEAIRKGNENWGAAVETGPEWGIWGVSVLIRAMNGEKIGNETQYPEPLLTKKNIPPPGEAYPVVIPDALEQYEKLWGI